MPGKEITLRPIEQIDLDFMFDLVNNSEVTKYIGGLIRDKNMLRTQTLAGEPIMELADFREQELVREVREQFHPMEEKSSFFLTREMIREFIDRATEICLHELNQLAQGKAGLDSFEWSWIKQG